MNNTSIITKELVEELIPVRQADSNKSTYGRACIVAGSRKYPGAAILASSALVRSGCGYSYIASIEKVTDMVVARHPEIIPVYLDEDNDGSIDKCELSDKLKKMDSIGFGSGMGQSETTYENLADLLTNYKGTIVIDADGLNMLSKDLSLLERSSSNIILTPHILEFSRLTQIEADKIKKDKLSYAKAFTERFSNVTLILKDYETIVSSNEEARILTDSTPALAKAGSGDVLFGLTTGIAATGLSPFDSASIAVFVHALAAKHSAKVNSIRSTTPTDVADNIGKAFLELSR